MRRFAAGLGAGAMALAMIATTATMATTAMAQPAAGPAPNKVPGASKPKPPPAGHDAGGGKAAPTEPDADMTMAPPPDRGAVSGYARRPPPRDPAPRVAPTPAPELVAAAKAMKGTYHCKGNVRNPDGSSRPSLATVKVGVELDGFWITVEMAETKTKDNPTPIKTHELRSYDAATRTWQMITVNNGGGSVTSTSTDAAGGPMTWVGTTMIDGKAFEVRDHEEPDAGGRTVHYWGETGLSGGTMVNVYDVTCKR